MIPINDASTRRQLAALHAEWTKKAPAIVAANASLAGLKGKLAALDGRLSAEQSSPAQSRRVSTEELADALAADPSADLDDGRIAAAVGDHAASLRASAERSARVAALEGATKKLREQIASARMDLERLEIEEENACESLLRAAHAALFEEFCARFVTLHEEVVLPMLALAENPSVRSPTLESLNSDSFVEVQRFVAGTDRGSGWKRTRLLHAEGPQQRQMLALQGAAAVDTFVEACGAKSR